MANSNSGPLPLDLIPVLLDWIVPRTRRLNDPDLRAFVACSGVCRLWRDASLGQRSTWKALYQLTYLYSDSNKEHARERALGDNWRSRFFARAEIDRRAEGFLLEVLHDLDRRHVVTYSIAILGLDILDWLEMVYEDNVPSYFQPVPSADQSVRPYALTRKWWARELLNVIPAMSSLRLWHRLTETMTMVSFEDAFNALSGFHGVHYIKLSKRLDELARQCHEHLTANGIVLNPANSNYNVRNVCEGIHGWMHSVGFKLATGEDFSNILNSFPHSYLYPTNPPKGTLQLSLVHVFVSIAKRFGILASPTNFPRHVVAHVAPLRPDVAEFWIDLANPDEPFFTRTTASLAHPANAPSKLIDQSLSPVGPFQLLPRALRNIVSAAQATGGLVEPMPHTHVCVCLSVIYGDDVFNALATYPTTSLVTLSCVYHKTLPHVADDEDTSNALRGFAHSQLNIYRDQVKTKVTHRSAMPTHIEFFIGAVIRHRLHGYLAAVVGWDYKCKANEDWIEAMNVDLLPRGRNQPFYTVLCNEEHATRRYVAEENMDICEVTKEEVLNLFHVNPVLAQTFYDVQHLPNDDGIECMGYAWLIPNFEGRHYYPEDAEAGEDWMTAEWES